MTGGGATRRAAGTSLGDRIAEQAYQLDAAMHRLLADLREFDAAGHWADAGAASCASWLAWRVGWDPGTAREHVRVARALGTLPLIDAALAAGRLSYSKTRALTRVATPATEAALLDDALRTTAAQLEVICRKLRAVQRLGAMSADDVRARRMVARRDRDDGMVVIEAVLPADEAAAVWAAIEREAARATAATEPGDLGGAPDTAPPADALTDVSAEAPAPVVGEARVPPALCRADGLVAMAQAVLRGASPARAPLELVLTISRDALAAPPGGSAPTTSAPAIGCFADGTAVAAATARRLACDCGVVAMATDADGTPLSVGRRTRSIPTAIARALAQRDAHCRFPGCTNRRFLDGHHLTHWIDGGATALDNLCRLCARHHRYVHEHGYQVELRDGEPVFFHRGREVHGEPPRIIDASGAWAAIRAANAARAIDATTGQCAWDGRPVDYAWVVDGLVGLERRAAPMVDHPQ
ncbi:MAG: DUF222 domain-containing protein [Myxococcales bacterium]|nr:DUF222 domain-containing protein [Myxococcales bacterium]